MGFNEAEALRCEMMAAGDRLLLALSVEEQFGAILGEDVEGFRIRWQKCRSTVDRLAEDYAAAIDRWRTAVEEGTGLDSPKAAKRSRRVIQLLPGAN